MWRKFLSHSLSISVAWNVDKVFNVKLVFSNSLADVITYLIVSLEKIILVFDPFLHVLCDVCLVSAIKGALSIFPSLVLSLPSEITVEIELFCACKPKLLAHINDMSEGDFRVSLLGVDQCVGVVIELGDFACSQIAVITLADLSRFCHLTLAADQDINDNLRFIVHDAIHAPSNRTFDI